MKTYLKLSLIIITFTTTATVAQTIKRIPTTVTVDGSGRTTEPPIYKDERGKILELKQVMSYMQTGDYKMVKTADKRNKPVFVVTKSPGFNRRPVANEVVVKPQ
ncbi:hypothetical protein [Mucilaginibacter aquatilis]|uniref:Uncharacterized protein n=1 Tax=Mucilaginibacter aquatilis TaxID=1517760 RepID=A0A6I4IQ67_9SPHI|nr:hypothetical protein [Mucilaginibacter aquatilis]MVN90574.1 hypothetical protein [Mucilaginibacter aquatilis]